MAFFMGEIRFHYYGRFVGDGESLEYVDGIVDNLTVDPDRLSHIELLGILDDAGEVLVMCDDLSIHGSVDIYVEHGVDDPEDAYLLIDGVEDVGEDGVVGDHGLGEQNAEQPAGDDHVGEQGLGDNGDANLNGQADIGDGQLGGDGGNGQGENNNIDDGQNVEVEVEDIDEVAVNATFDDFETSLEEMVQQGINKVRNDGEGSVEGASDDEVEEGPFIGLDGSFLKSLTKGELLVVVGRDGNNQMFPFTWALVEVECIESWLWFLENLSKDIDFRDGNTRPAAFPIRSTSLCLRKHVNNAMRSWNFPKSNYQEEERPTQKPSKINYWNLYEWCKCRSRGMEVGIATTQFASENAERTNGHAIANVNTTNQIPANAQSTTLHEKLNVAPMPREENARNVRATVNRATTLTQGEASSSKRPSKNKRPPKAYYRALVGRVILENDGRVISSTEPEFRIGLKSVAKMQGRSGNPNVQRSRPANLQRSVATSSVGSQPSGRQILNPEMTNERIINIGDPNIKKTRTHTDLFHGTQESGVEDSFIQSLNPSKTGKGKQKDPWRF
ncbi:hypothetical protein COLO4_30243 [Corchorus olitorius]|uniref:MULE transposase domain-containing protein n=1 Tax=Corchorus olitorius TaxID=93759 RepID=A0A1R3H9W9_9ROSI|nr:hypothetical protein COLO4_30243 [Corchorus olitorius]